MRSTVRFEGKVAIVTGAAGPGIGRATARELAREGAMVVVSDRDGERASKVALEIAGTGAQAIGLKCDVSQAADVEAMVRVVVDRWGRTDILVNNAAYYRQRHVVDMEEVLWDRVIATALKGTFLCSRAVLPHMSRQGGGAIVNLSSTEALQGSDRGLAHYAAAKAGIMAFTRSLAREAAKSNIRVNCVCPSFVWNEGLATTGFSQAEHQKMIAETPMGRAATPQEVAKAILFLCSEDASFITGSTLTVSGGRLML